MIIKLEKGTCREVVDDGSLCLTSSVKKVLFFKCLDLIILEKKMTVNCPILNTLGRKKAKQKTTDGM